MRIGINRRLVICLLYLRSLCLALYGDRCYRRRVRDTFAGFENDFATNRFSGNCWLYIRVKVARCR